MVSGRGRLIGHREQKHSTAEYGEIAEKNQQRTSRYALRIAATK